MMASNQVALVTGASAGMGKDFAKALLFMRKWFSDRMFDSTIMSMFK